MSIQFEKISKYKNLDFSLPQRATKHSAGYDIAIMEDRIVPSIYKIIIKTIFKRFTDPKYIEQISETNIGQSFKYFNSLKDTLSKEEMEQYLIEKFTKSIVVDFKEVLDLFNNQFTLDLNTMKTFIKEENSQLVLLPTYLKAKMNSDQVLKLYIRSSIPLNNYLMLGNGTGIIDADYYNNPENEGHIQFEVINFSPFDIFIKKGDIIGQGIFEKYKTTIDDKPGGDRTGGTGSTTN